MLSVDIAFKNRKLGKECNNDKEMVKAHGPIRAKKLRQRLDDLSAASNLSVMRAPMPGRCHELSDGRLAMDLDGPYRLIFQPLGEGIYKDDGGLDWKAVTSIIILSIEDYHD